MVELPRYVKAIRKPGGRAFVYYERFRGTAAAWPRVRLPSDTASPEFWTRADQCAQLAAERTGDGWRFVWPGGEERRYDLPDPGEGGDAFWRAVDGAVEAERTTAAGERKTFRALVAHFKTSERWNALAAKSKRDYERYLDVILAAWADDPVRDLTTPDAQEAIDAYAGSPASGRYFRAVLARLLAYGIPRGFSTINVAEPSEKPDHKVEPYEPWPDWALEILFTFARPALHLPALSALYTGQRKVDVIPMLDPGPGATGFDIVARKQGKTVPIQIHSVYRRALDAARPAPDPGVVALRHVPAPMHRREDGEPWTYEGFTTAWGRDLDFGVDPGGRPPSAKLRQAAAEREANPDKVAAMLRLRNAGLVFHGFRKNAVISLLEVGCTEAEVSAIVEMSEQMVRHYARDVDKRRLAVAAMRKLESMRPAGFATTGGNA